MYQANGSSTYTRYRISPAKMSFNQQKTLNTTKNIHKRYERNSGVLIKGWQ